MRGIHHSYRDAKPYQQPEEGSEMDVAPGPWICTNSSHHYHDYQLVGLHGQLPFTQEMGRNTARLIGAAPELLAAVEMVLEASENGGDMDDIDWQWLRSVVAQAKGE